MRKNIFLKRMQFLGILLIQIFTAHAQINIATTETSGCDKADGTATVSVGTGGFDLEYSMDGGAYKSSGSFDKLKGGSHSVSVKDKTTKCTFSKSFTIEEKGNDLSVSISGTGTTEFCNNQSPPTITLTANASGGSGKYVYSWPGGSISVSSSGTHSVTVTDTATGCTKSTSGEVIFIPIICSKDPNDIIGPEGYGPGKMIAKSKQQPYIIRFENDPDFATAPAQIVKINHPLDSNVNVFSLRLGDFGFAGMTFNVPSDKIFYTTRLDVIDSLGVVVDVTAGIDASKREAFWIFESKDPSTGLPPADASLGFLPVNDSTTKGEGFVSYTVKAANHTSTGDSIHAKASIIFDINGAIETPVIFNTLDAMPPSSFVKPLPETTYQNTIALNWTGQDDLGGSGLKDYDLYVAENSGAFVVYRPGLTDTTLMFTGSPGNTYRFFSLAKDNVGNQEVIKTIAEATIQFITNCPDNAKIIYYKDSDGDGFGNPSDSLRDCTPPLTYVLAKGDCNDNNNALYPGATEVCNGVDDNCNGQVDEGVLIAYFPDTDRDSFGDLAGKIMSTPCSSPEGFVRDSSDCNDANATVYPGAPELCDSLDNNCNGIVNDNIQPITWYQDSDADNFGNAENTVFSCTKPVGYVSNSGDCNDSDENIFPGAIELCDNVDNNCNGQVDEGLPANVFYQDTDRDGYGSAVTISTCNSIQPIGYAINTGDCNDADSTVSPNATESCNGKDDNCNGLVDEGCNKITYFRDQDSDGYGKSTDSIQAFSKPAGYVLLKTDCNDADANVNPGSTESCNGKDDNCNGINDEGCGGTYTYYKDVDNDGYGRDSDTKTSSTPVAGYVLIGGDCIDWDASVHPGMAETANGKDDNCNGTIDEGFVLQTYFKDVDGDGFGRASETKTSSVPVPGFVLASGDCEDWDASVYPGATEICDNKDNNCNGLIDEGLITRSFFKDVDGDGFGRNSESVTSCAASAPAGFTVNSGDCVDWDASINPGMTEIANGKDDNCNGIVDEGLSMQTYYKDVDGDGFGRNSETKISAIPVQGFVLIGGDCVDWDNTIYPGKAEIANGKDDNCNGQTDEGLSFITYYKDVDGDGFGRATESKISAIPVTGYVTRGGDCVDWDASIYPQAVEICDNKDNDCDGVKDNGLQLTTYFKDVDGDGFGRVTESINSCSQNPPTGYVRLNGDCVDWDITINPSAIEIRNGRDDNCNLIIDDVQLREGVAGSSENSTSTDFTISPIPSEKEFHIAFSGVEIGEKITLTIHDNVGKVVETINDISVGQTISIGSDYARGIYNVSMLQGKTRKTRMIIKL